MSIRRRISDPATDAVLRGDGPGLRALGRPDLAAVADVVAPLRRTARDDPVQPTAALAALLAHGARGLARPTGAAPQPAPLPAAGPDGRYGRKVTAPNRRQRMVWEWLGGLGLAAKLGAASAVTVASVGLTGAAGALPDPVQDDFDKVVATVTPFERGDDASTAIPVVADPPRTGGATPTDDATSPDDATTPDAGPTTGATPSADDTTPDDATPTDTPTDDASDDAADDHGGRTADDSDDSDDHDSGTPSGSRHRSGSSKDDEDRSGSSRGSGSGSDDDEDEDRSGSSRGGSDHGDRSGSSHDEADDASDERDHQGSGGSRSGKNSGKDSGKDSGNDSTEDEPEDESEDESEDD